MATITYTVTVQSTGSGNKYFIDGVQTPTLTLAVGNTYRFDTSDSSMGPHPFLFSTTSNGTHGGGSEYTTGVTKNGTPGQAGAYIEIAVSTSTASFLYYYCQYHGGMGGNILATTLVEVSSAGLAAFGSSTWGSLTYGGNNQPNVTVGTGTLAFPEQGWGGKAWGRNLWGELSDNNVVLTGNSLTIAIGTETAEGVINQGWGRSSWGSNIWNGYGTVVPNSNSLSASLNSVTINGEINSGWGGEAWGDNAWGIFGDALVSGNQISVSNTSNKDAWGSGTWSDYNTSWGGTGSVDVGIFQEVSVTGESLTLTGADVTEEIAVEVLLSENPLSTLSSAGGTADPAPDSMPAGVQLATSLGTVLAYNEQGWGRDAWNEEVWGGEGEWATVSLTGFGLTIDSGLRESWGQDTWGASTTEWGGVFITETDISTDVEVSTNFVPGWGSSIAWGAQKWGQATVDMSMTANEGTVDPAPDAFITGVAATTSVSDVVTSSDGKALPSGVLSTISIGNEDAVPNTKASPSGVQITSVMGVPTAGLSVLVSPTGVTSTFSTGIIGLNAWAIVDPGTAPTWTVVDKAA